MGAMAARLGRSLGRYVPGLWIPRTPPRQPDGLAFALSCCDMCTTYFVEVVSDGSPMNLHGKWDDNAKYWYCWQCWEWWQEAWSAIYLKWAVRWASTPRRPCEWAGIVQTCRLVCLCLRYVLSADAWLMASCAALYMVLVVLLELRFLLPVVYSVVARVMVGVILS